MSVDSTDVEMDSLLPTAESPSAFTEQISHRLPATEHPTVDVIKLNAFKTKVKKRQKAYENACKVIASTDTNALDQLEKIFNEDSSNDDEIPDSLYKIIDDPKIDECCTSELNGMYKVKSLTEWSKTWSILHEAADHGNLDICKYLIETLKMTPAEEEEYSPIHVAASRNHTPVIEYILTLPDASSCARLLFDSPCKPDSKTPLHFALKNRASSAAKLLLEMGASIDKDTKQGKDALVLAVLRDDEIPKYQDWSEIFEKILKETAHFERNRKKNVFDFMAKENTNKKSCVEYMRKIVEYLKKEKYTDDNSFQKKMAELLNHTNLPDEMFPLREAVIHNNIQFIDLISEYIRLDKFVVLEGTRYGFQELVKVVIKKCMELLPETDANGQNVLHLAAMHKGYSIIDEIFALKERGKSTLSTMVYMAMCNTRDKKDHTPAYYAAKYGFDKKHFEKLLGDHERADYEDRRERKLTKPLLHVAAKYGRKEIVEYLLEKGWDSHIKNSYLQNTLMIAVIFGHLEVVKVLADFDRSLIDQLDKGDNSALHLAIFHDQIEVVKYLITNTALLGRGIRNTAQEDVLCVAIKNCNYKSAEAILKLGDNWQYDCEERNEEEDDQLVEDVKTTDPPLILAARMGLVKIVKLLLKKQAKYGITKDREKALEAACKNKHLDVVRILLQDYVKDNEYWREHLGDLLLKFPKAGLVALDHAKLDASGECALFSNDLHDDCHTLLCLAKTKDRDLLNHKIVREYCKKHWNNGWGRYLYHTGVLLYLLLMLLFSALIAYSNEPYTSKCSSSCDNSTLMDNVLLAFHLDKWKPLSKASYNTLAHEPIPSSNEKCYCANDTEIESTKDPCSQPSSLRWLYVFNWIFLSIQIVKEIIQMFIRKKNYWSGENFLEIVSLVLMLGILSSNTFSEDSVMNENTWILAAATQALGWAVLAYMLTKYPGIGCYLTMFYMTVKTYARFICVFLPLFFAFSTSFSTLMRNRCDFGTSFTSFTRTLVMMTGEFDFSSLFYASESSYNDKMFNFTTTMILFLLFCMIINILLSNLLTGIAVDNTKDALEKAKIEGRATQLTLIVELRFLTQLKDNFFKNLVETLRDIRCHFWEKEKVKEFLYTIGHFVSGNLLHLFRCIREYPTSFLLTIDHFLCNADFDEEHENLDSSRNSANENVQIEEINQLAGAIGELGDQIVQLRDEIQHLKKLQRINPRINAARRSAWRRALRRRIDQNAA